MLKIFIALTIIMTAGCISGTDKKAIEDAVKPPAHTSNELKPADDAITDIEGCYMQVLKRDTFTASLQQQGNTVTGRLSFDNYEKDGSTGTVSGKIQGDVLKLEYAFVSEGMNSVMELYFKYQDGMLVRGIGEMKSKEDTAYYVNPALIKYDGGELKKISCPTLPDKYK